jgi:tetratricopeptide (TPR) repeat protein
MSSIKIQQYSKKITDAINNNKYDIAIENYNLIIAENPIDINKYYMEMGDIYIKMNLFINAITDGYIKILKTDQTNGYILHQIGMCYSNLTQYKLAIHYFKKVLQIKKIPEIYSNIGICYMRMKDYKNATIHLINGIEVDKNNIVLQHSLGDIYYYTKDYKKSIFYYNKDKDLTNYVNLYNTSFPYLAQEDFVKGFELYEYRLKINEKNQKNEKTQLYDRVDIPLLDYWDGVKKCDNLLIVYEQGIGDNIQYYRFIIELSQLNPNMKITYLAKEIVVPIFKRYNNITIIDNVNDMRVFKNFDYKMYIMSLPKILNKSIIYPTIENYIHIDEDKLTYWKNKFSSFKRLKVGFVYNGLLSSFIEKYIPLKEFKILCDLDIDLICIHKKTDIEKEMNDIDFKDKINCFDIDVNKPFEDTIHILKNIDLLITIDTYIVHLAGVLGLKTWLLLGFSDWRWSTKSTTYWYDSVEIIRTNDQIEFNSILQKVKPKLVDLVTSPNLEQAKGEGI